VRPSSRSLAGVDELVAVCSCLCCLAFRWSSDAARRHFFANDEELRRVEKLTTTENAQLTELLFHMIPVTQETTKGKMFGRLLELVRAGEEHRQETDHNHIDGSSDGSERALTDGEEFTWQLFGASNAHATAAQNVSLDEERRRQRSAQAVRDILLTAPRHFGLRGSVFATRVLDKPFLLIRVCSTFRAVLSFNDGANISSSCGHGSAAELLSADECMRHLLDAISAVPHASLVKTNGDVVVVAVEATGISMDRECVLLTAVAAALSRAVDAPRNPAAPELKRSSVTETPPTTMRCMLTAGPAVGGVLGTAALTFEYFGEPIETAQRLLLSHDNESFLWPTKHT
jgi:class 3 adenylate cyclase